MAVRVPDLKEEANRLQTFASVFGYRTFSLACLLTEKGCYYIDEKKLVQCAFCKKEEAYKGDDYRIVKLIHKPQCDLSENVALTETKRIRLVTEMLYKSFDAPSVTDGHGGRGIALPYPTAFPQYDSYQSRRETYPDHVWNNAGSPVKPHKLVVAGFFYRGPEYQVACFHCEGELANWRLGDIPLKEHAKYYPGCGWMQKNHGTDFIREQRATMSVQEREVELRYRRGDISFLPERQPTT